MRELVVILAFEAGRSERGRPLLTKKLLSGLDAYGRHWDGPVTGLFHPAAGASRELDEIEFCAEPNALVRAEIVSFGTPEFYARLSHAAVVAGFPHYLLPTLGAECRRRGVPLVMSTEYTLRTRLQIARVESTRLAAFIKRGLWEWKQEQIDRINLSQAAGLQCNGTPTYEAYRAFCRDAMLYFDTRLSEHLVVSEQSLNERVAQLGRPLRLVFSGRLAAMKGAQHLPAVAAALRAEGVPFALEIFGDGPLRTQIERDVLQQKLSDHVKLRGVLDFATQLVPHVSTQSDLFVCTHVQGDPSCTYLETLGCGVPIVGFANEAWAGMLRVDPAVGWSVPVGDARALARQIAALDRDRAALSRAARAGRAFAQSHTFERTFQARVEHLKAHARGDQRR
jgi:glycosyltransferase involved in cell wall biosynthesis